MDETGDVYVADGLYDADDDTNGIRVGASTVRAGARRWQPIKNEWSFSPHRPRGEAVL